MRELKAGDNVWLRDDLVEGIKYGNEFFVKGMIKGIVITIKESNEDTCKWFNVFGDDRDYSYEMVDWDKTEKMWEGQNNSPSKKGIEFCAFYAEGLATDLMNVNEKEKQEKIVMPKVFDDWFNSVEGFSIFDQIQTLTDNFYNSSLDVKFYKFVKNNKEKCIRAMLDGYEIEEEPVELYTVDCGGNKGLARNFEGDIVLSNRYRALQLEIKQLTQEEIENSEHSVLMAIAKEVEEGE